MSGRLVRNQLAPIKPVMLFLGSVIAVAAPNCLETTRPVRQQQKTPCELAGRAAWAKLTIPAPEH
jgi:hypothetical protein